jgi:predicted nucleotidyltransferase
MTYKQLPVGIRRVLEDLRKSLSTLYGERLKGVYLYGSYARGTARESSDIDVLVVLAGGLHPGREITRMGPGVSKVCLDHNVLVSVVPMVEQEYLESSLSFVRNVRVDAVAV